MYNTAIKEVKVLNGSYKKTRYVMGKGVSISHTWGESAEKSTLSYSHYTKDCMFYYFIKGKGSIKVEGRIYDIEEGDIILVNPSELFMCEIYGNAFHERLVLRVNHAILDNFLQDGASLISPFYNREKGNGNHIPCRIVESSGIKNHMEEIFMHAKSSQPSENILAVCKTIELLSDFSKLKFFDAKTDNTSGNPLIDNVLTYLNEHFRENMTIEYVASLFHIEKSYLSHLFKEHVGIPLWNYVICKRLNYFNDIICQNQSIDEAYVLAGFQNYSNFFRLYKKYMNMTPSEFKRQNDKL